MFVYIGRVVEATNCQTVPLILAAKRTHRIDPLDGFNYYEGGWNISDEHYLSVSIYKHFPNYINLVIIFYVNIDLIRFHSLG